MEEDSQIGNVPVMIMGGNRPKYLFGLLMSMAAASGFDASLVTVYLSGFHQGREE